MYFDYQCLHCHHTTTIKGKIGEIPTAPSHHKIKMRRVYDVPRFSVQRSRAEYLELATEGREAVPGFTAKEVRQTLDRTFTKAS